jgi:hypothetical protein
MRARMTAGLDDMGNTAAGRLLGSNVTSGGGDTPTTPNATGGEANHTLTQAQLPAISPSITITDPGHTHTTAVAGATNSASGGGQATPQGGNTGTSMTGITAAFTSTLGSGAAANVMNPFMLGTFYQKL